MGIKERKELEKQGMRKLILDTAMKLFLEKGFENITIRHIAEQIEYSPATIYLYFKDKDDILYTLHYEGFEELYRRQLKTLTIKDPLKRLHMHARMYVSFGMENPEYYDLMFIKRAPIKTINEMKLKKIKDWNIGKRSYDILRKNIEDCMEVGAFKKTNIDVAAFSLWSYVHGIVSLIIMDRCAMFPQERMGDIVEGALNFMQESMSIKNMEIKKTSKNQEEI
ncbi:MAG: TetR/AcrR family transcriptional regulator [Candidatus Methanoperedens sp.]|nr:TetR/AcrR family transcriptional regulator [Candidatus Methanoperedens sp.]